MKFSDYLLTVGTFVRAIPFSLFDYSILFAIGFYLYQELLFGMKSALKHFLIILLSFFTGVFFYPFISILIRAVSFAVYQGYSDGIAFLTVIGGLFILLSWGSRHIFLDYPEKTIIHSVVNGLFGIAGAFCIGSVITLVLLTLPISNYVKDIVRQSTIARVMDQAEQQIELAFNGISHSSTSSTLGFVSINPSSDGRMSILFSQDTIKEEKQAEKRLTQDINKQRGIVHLPPFEVDESLVHEAQTYGADMIRRQYFGHTTPENFTLLDRLESHGIVYSKASESIALAQSFDLGFEGLLVTQENRNNLLSRNFHSIGIAIYNEDAYGQLMVLLFTE